MLKYSKIYAPDEFKLRSIQPKKLSKYKSNEVFNHMPQTVHINGDVIY